MSRTCSINRREPQAAVVIRASIPGPDIGAGIRTVLPEIATWVTSHGVEMAGAPFVRYRSMSATEADIEVGIPVASPATGDNRVSAVQLPGGEAGVIAYYGPYEGDGTAHSELRAWLAEQGRTLSSWPWESYVTDAAAEPDPARWLTEVVYPV